MLPTSLSCIFMALLLRGGEKGMEGRVKKKGKGGKIHYCVFSLNRSWRKFGICGLRFAIYAVMINKIYSLILVGVQCAC